MKLFLPISLALGFAALLVMHPAQAAQAVRDGLILCFQTVVPSLFPFFAVMSLLLKLGLGSLLQPICSGFMGPLFHLRGLAATPLIAGILGGYPTGAKTAAQLYEQGSLTKDEAELLLGFCNNCGPGFLLGFVGAGILGSTRAGVYLFLIHVAAALLTGIVLCRLPRRTQPPPLPCHLLGHRVSVARAVTASVSDALTSTLGICAYVVLFRTAAALLGAALPAGMLGALEMVSGIAALTGSESGFMAAAAITAWGGVSVHCQTMSVVGDLSLRYHAAGKILQTVIAVFLALMAAKMVYR